MMIWYKRFLVTGLIFSMLIPCVLAANPQPLLCATAAEPSETAVPSGPTEPSETTEPSEPAVPDPSEPSEPAEPDPLEGYTFPDNWAAEPLKFAVRHGILEGHGGFNLAPTGKTTRAEMAAMLVRLMKAPVSGDLSGYSDINPNAWYCEELATAVDMGIFNGVTDTIMAPQRHITRQEAFTVLARAFGLEPQNPAAYEVFSDSNRVKPFAQDAVSALYELGCVSGYENNCVKPTAYISRQEVAALFYKLLTHICDSPSQLPESGMVLYRGTEPLPEGYRLDGSLILTSSDVSDLHGITISHTLYLRCPRFTKISLEDLTVDQIVVASGMELEGGNFPRLSVLAPDAIINSTVCAIFLKAPATLSGSYEEMHCCASDSTAVLDGTAHSVTLHADNITLTGAGQAAAVIIHGRDCTVSLNADQVDYQIDWLLRGVQVALTAPASWNSFDELTIHADFTGLQTGYGTTDGQRPCDLRWYCNGILLSEQKDFLLGEDTRSTIHYTPDPNTLPENLTFTAVLTCGVDRVQKSCAVTADKYTLDYLRACKTVQTVNVEAKTLVATKLYTDKACSGVIRNVEANVPVTHMYYSDEAGVPGQVRLADGTVGWMDWSDYLVSEKDYTQSQDYSLGTKEGFVNLNGYSSPTDYMIWLSLKTQRVNIYRGSKGSWKLVRTAPCSTGKNTTPTVSGVYSIIYKTPIWRFLEDYTRVYNVTGFWGGQAFHSRLYYYDDTICDGTIGTPASHGCVRMMDEDCRYIYEELPQDTTVVIY